MEFRNLRAFIEVVRAGGFSRAAERIHATQSTVSKSVRNLEDEIGVPLLHRMGHRTALTDAGEIVYQRGLRLLADRETLLAEVGEITGLRSGALRLGLPPIGSSVLFAPIFTTYRKRYPAIDIRLVEHGSDRLEEALHAGEIDLAASLLPVSDEFGWQRVRREQLTALIAPDHPLARRRKVTLDDLRAVPFILFDIGFALNRIIFDACARVGFEPEIAARSSQIDFIVELAAAGLGVAFLPQMIADQRAHVSVARVPLDQPDTAWDMAILWRKDAFVPHAARAWLDIVGEVYPAS